MKHSIYSDRVVLGTGADLTVAPARISWDNGVITEVLTEGSPVDLCTEARDLRGLWVAPGFVNAHTHLAMHAFRGGIAVEGARGNLVEDVYYRLEASLQPGDVRAFSRVAAMECLLAGTTTVFDHYYAGHEVAQALVDVGLTGRVAPTLQDLSGPGVLDWEQQLQRTLDLHFDTSMQYHGVFAALGPHATDTVSGPLWSRIAALSREHDLPVHAHLAQSLDEVQRVRERTGRTPGEWLAELGLFDEVRGLWVHGLYLTRAELEKIADGDGLLGFCPASQALFEFPAPLDLWQELGLSVALGTDAGASADGMDVQQELRALAACVSSRVTFGAPLRAWQDGTSTPELVRRQRDQTWSLQQELQEPTTLLRHLWQAPAQWSGALRVGALEVGARANLLVLDPRHPALWPGGAPVRALAYAQTQAALWGVVSNGSWIGEPGDHRAALRSDQWSEWVDEASERADAWRRRAGLH